MAKIINKVVISHTPPNDTNVGWIRPLSNRTFMLFFFNEKGWSPIYTESSGELNFQQIQEVPDIIIKIQ